MKLHIVSFNWYQKIFGMLKLIQVNFNEKTIDSKLISEQISTPCSLFCFKLHNHNHAILNLMDTKGTYL